MFTNKQFDLAQESLNGPSIDAMLRGLTDRPNVQATLILSKTDGSIIRAAGVIVSDQQLSSGAGSQYQWSRSRQDEQETSKVKEQEQSDGDQQEDDPARGKQQPVELLAASVFQFVNNAASLGLTLGSISRDSGISGTLSYKDSSTSNQEASAEEDHARTKDDEVQLLRLRTRYQEIIVFPDPNYICCVVQKVGKAGSNPDRR
ncbi:uncharacterized protein A1O9_03303 [Exophiala aquamarina CBS 119918]|uniref:Roadblock/LAMTOR2 domain-containing protein n=1 Tax=Exophiala aquamarina CBS 119918 TaxID=1182545 RepID=A0A072PQY1_9EURO|nr:uncharacterized protein A1O9_03303 [Exophiala aquamarina CBS 119918]KEF61733.1 hypothetical protein A1O9_03303 [Exophiala aquamarina CBS 119918]